MAYGGPPLDALIIRAGVGRMMAAQTSPAVRAKGWALLPVPKSTGWKRSARLLRHLGVFSRMLAFVLARLFYIATGRRVIARLVVIAIWREERRAKTKPIRDINEAPEERIKIPPPGTVAEPPGSEPPG